jgi:hypothetical protein
MLRRPWLTRARTIPPEGSDMATSTRATRFAAPQPTERPSRRTRLEDPSARHGRLRCTSRVPVSASLTPESPTSDPCDQCTGLSSKCVRTSQGLKQNISGYFITCLSSELFVEEERAARPRLPRPLLPTILLPNPMPAASPRRTQDPGGTASTPPLSGLDHRQFQARLREARRAERGRAAPGRRRRVRAAAGAKRP